jgi:hypothetical protein
MGISEVEVRRSGSRRGHMNRGYYSTSRPFYVYEYSRNAGHYFRRGIISYVKRVQFASERKLQEVINVIYCDITPEIGKSGAIEEVHC